MRALLAQLSPVPGEPTANAARAAEVVAAHPEPDLAVFPGPELATVSEAAAAANTAVVIGLARRLESGGAANAVACFKRDGELVGVYRKTHLFGEETDAFEAGDSLLVL